MNNKCPIENCDNQVKSPFSICCDCLSEGEDNYRGSNLTIILKQ